MRTYQTWQLVPHTDAAKNMAERNEADVINPHSPEKKFKLSAWVYFGCPKNKWWVVLEDGYPVYKSMDIKWLSKEEMHQTCLPILENTICQ